MPRSATTKRRCASTWPTTPRKCSKPPASKTVQTYDKGSHLGMAIHEMGTARMGRDPKTSVLNAH
ncbi:MAG: GMC oxidoreductase [Chthoniobacter sp.]